MEIETMENITEKLKKAKQGEFIHDSETGITYQILEESKGGSMPVTIARSGDCDST